MELVILTNAYSHSRVGFRKLEIEHPDRINILGADPSARRWPATRFEYEGLTYVAFVEPGELQNMITYETTQP